MSCSRRKFFRTLRAVFTGFLGWSALSGASAALCASSMPQAPAQNIPARVSTGGDRKAGRWGMAFFTAKITGISNFYNIIHACHTAHNVPDIEGEHAIKWIWSAGFLQSFSADQAAEDLLRRRFLLLCNHCAHPPCVRVCPTKASFKRKDGLVLIDHDFCIGCRACMSACPYGARSFNFLDPLPHIREPVPDFPARPRGVVEKCNFCAERLAAGLQPHCAEASGGAIVVGDLSDSDSDISRALKNNYSIRRKDPPGLGLNVHYIL